MMDEPELLAIMVLASRAKPAPVSFIDNFARANGAIGNDWICTTGQIIDGKVIISPTMGAELTTDGELESWIDPNNLTSWVENKTAPQSINQDGADKHGGDYSCRLDPGGSTAGGFSIQQNTIYPGAKNLLLFDFWAKTEDALGFGGVYLGRWGTPFNNTSWANIRNIFYAADGNPRPLFAWYSGANSSIWYDDISIKSLAWSSLFNVRPAYATPNGIFSTKVSSLVGWAGLVACLDSVVTPANDFIAYVDGINFYLDMVKAGTKTNLITNRVDFVANGEIKIVKKDASIVCYYDGVAQSAPITNLDAAVKDGLIFGQFSTHAETSFAEFSSLTPTDAESSTAYLDPYLTAVGGNIFPIGDSKTAGDGDETRTDGLFGYPSILVKELSRANLGFWDELPSRIGIGGATVNYFHTNLAGLLASKTGTPTHVLFNLGTNDTISDSADWITKYLGLIDQVHTKYADAKIFIAKPWSSSGGDSHWDNVAGYVDVIVAARSAYTFVGHDERVTMKPNYPAYFADSVHPNHLGYTAMALGWVGSILG